jgi:hypothetical protein
VGFFHRRPKLRPFDESTAYSRLHGHRAEDVKIVKIEPKRPRFEPKVSGEVLRAAFEQRLDLREPEDEAKAKRTRAPRKKPVSAALPEANEETPAQEATP